MTQKPGIVYALVAKSATVVFAETSSSAKDVPGIAKRLLETIDFGTDSKKVNLYQGYSYGNQVAKGVCYLAVCEEKLPNRVTFSFLARLQEEYEKNHSKKGNASEFKKFMENEKNFFSSNAGGDKLIALQGQVDEVKGIMLNNIETTIKRGEKLEDLDMKAAELDVQTSTFHTKTKKLKCELLKKNIKLTFAIAGCCLLIILIIVLIVVFTTK